MKEDIRMLKKELESTQDQFWNIDKDAGELLQSLVFIHRPKQLLEIGTSNGYSAILMAEVASQYGGHITTIEYFEKRIELAQENITKAGLSDSISILQGDALEVLQTLEQRIDFAFIDANKKQYGKYLEHCLRLTNPGALIVADNTISHRNKLDDFFTAIQTNKSIDVLEVEIGTGLVITSTSIVFSVMAIFSASPNPIASTSLSPSDTRIFK